MSAYLNTYDNGGTIASASTISTQAPLDLNRTILYTARVVQYADRLAQLTGPANSLGYGGSYTVLGAYVRTVVPVRIGRRYGVLSYAPPPGRD